MGILLRVASAFNDAMKEMRRGNWTVWSGFIGSHYERSCCRCLHKTL